MKFEFGDLYKFIVSLGVVIISISVLVPWLFLKEPFDLYKSETDLKSVTSVAHAAILGRQEAVAFIVKFIPWFSVTGCICGLIFVFAGLKKWHANQLLLDEQTKVEVEIKKQSLRDATKDEIALSAARDMHELAPNENHTSNFTLSAFEASYAQIESLVTKRLQDVYSRTYEVESNKMVAGIEVDVLLRGRNWLTKDYIIEIKSIRRGFNYGWLRESFLKNIYAKNIYAQATNRIPNTLLLIVTELKCDISEKYNSMLEKISKEGLGRRGKDSVVIIDKEELHNLATDQFQRRLGIYT
ncbi:hypothetical protein [Pseudomonas sp. B11(2017)]|uniref:hypothetical protein n=1 Tax=Pseudomonas sp. B11(2017) TaxID=1981748 RepID=UPI00111C6B27|nr:hypothetical protein [Pseudomonas sp. B11(2017)]